MNDSAPASMAPGATPPPAKQPLDEIMLAMDVVDTLRRRERLVAKELADSSREQDLKERLRKIYKSQGIDVPDRILEEGVSALKEDRFVYKPRSAGLGRSLANLYVSRHRWGKWVLGGIAVIVAAVLVNYFAVVLPDKALPNDLAEAHTQVASLAQSDDARSAADRLYASGEDAIGKGDTDAARKALASLESLGTTLSQSYTLKVLNRPDERSGVWRVPDANTSARNYYLIVEGIDSSGNVVTVPITNEETGKLENVTKWGLRVERNTFEQVARDKQDDGIIERNVVGEKKRGRLKPDYVIPTTGAAITEW